MKKKGVIYSRYSDDMQQGESIEAQNVKCEEYAEKHNIKIVKPFLK